MGLAHMKDFLNALDTRKRTASDVEIDHNSMLACHLANVAFRTGRVVHWDAAREQITGDTEAQSSYSGRIGRRGLFRASPGRRRWLADRAAGPGAAASAA
jgi:hypothetical protein